MVRQIVGTLELVSYLVLRFVLLRLILPILDYSGPY